MKRWYLARCKRRQEKKVINHFESQGWECYCPFIIINKSRNVVTRRVLEPIFPGYVFVNLDFKSDNWAAVKYTRGVLGLVQFGQKPAIVSTKIIEDLRENAPKSQINLSADESFSTGDTVSITEGSLKGLNAIYQCSSGKDRVIVLINLLGHNTKAGIKQDYIRKVSSV